MDRHNMNKPFFYTIAILVLVTTFYCNKVVAQNNFVPDTTINNLFFLENTNSSEIFFPNIDSVKRFDEELFSVDGMPHIIFYNADKTKYLVAFFHYGGSRNSISEFEIGYVTEKNATELNRKSNETTYNDFQTENNLRLGMTLKELEEIKGKNYIRKDNVVTYIINEEEVDSDFLNEYNMPEYYLECEIVQNKVCRIRFGFTYP